MQNYHAIETEVAHRRFEHERRLSAAAQVTQTRSENRRTRWSHLPHWTLPPLYRRFLQRVPGSLRRTAATQRTEALDGGRTAVA